MTSNDAKINMNYISTLTVNEIKCVPHKAPQVKAFVGTTISQLWLGSKQTNKQSNNNIGCLTAVPVPSSLLSLII